MKNHQEGKARRLSFEKMFGLYHSLVADLKVALASGTKQKQIRTLQKLKMLRRFLRAHSVGLQAQTGFSSQLIEQCIASSSEHKNKLDLIRQELEMHRSDLTRLVKSRDRTKRASPTKTRSKWLRS